MKQKDTQREEAFAALQHSYEKACSTVEFLAKEAVRYGLWEHANFGERLSDLYLRLKRGPVRAVIMGQTSSGKSTLINALVGSIIAPESADACSPIPICFMRDKKQTSETHITYFDKQKHNLPQEKYANQTSLLQWHHDSGTLAQDNGTRPFVHTASETFPQLATLIDSPGLNANGTDTDILYALFDQPSYATADDPDLPELVLYISTAGGNLSEEELKSLKLLLDKGVDPHRIFVVHNEFCADLENLQTDQFERTDNAARNGLAESFRALLPPSTPDVFSMDIDDSSAIFDAFLDDAFGNDVSVSSEDEAYAHIVSLNALFARVFYAGAYNPLANLITGATEDQYKQLLAAKKNPKQDRVIELCAAWRQANHADYQPLLHLRDVINEQALNLAGTADLKAALRAVNRLGDELLERRIQQLSDEAVRDRKPILEWVKRLDELRIWLNDAYDSLPQKTAKWHGEFASRLNGMLLEIKEKQDRRIRGMAEGIAAASNETPASRFWRGAKDGSADSLVARLASGLIWATSSSALKNQFDISWWHDPFIQKSQIFEQDQQLFEAYQKPESGQDVFAALERICKEMIATINETHLKQDDESIEAVQKLLEDHCRFLPAMLKEEAARIQCELSSYCQTMQEEARGKDRQLIDDLMMQPKFSAAVSALFEYKLNRKIPEQISACYGNVVSALRGAMKNPIQKTDHIAQQIRERYSKLGTQVVTGGHRSPEVSLKNVRDLVFRQVVCPILEYVATNTIGTFDTAKISEQMDKLLEPTRKYAVQALEDVFLNGFELINECYDVFGKVMAQWRNPEEDEDVHRLARIMALFEQSLSESAEEIAEGGF